MTSQLENDLSMKTYQILTIMFSFLLCLGGVIYIIWSFFVERDVKTELKEGRARIEDDMMTYPRCRTAAEEYGLEVVTPWKDYFTRDTKPFHPVN
ncbi:unnamed protein product [Bursaphelenchus okinawaensis]|uniref:Uncharacterized protein n=1 Tax=Bursaphelenchus okinawaensis TaxID=465554 RepID=A0A811L9W5_9BILA|nr:unnamed protein product [Bursaphelenchus okinawaensis]CAG9120390.1 unnamed protein product [Bursaphelenchus okinawaensis]